MPDRPAWISGRSPANYSFQRYSLQGLRFSGDNSDCGNALTHNTYLWSVNDLRAVCVDGSGGASDRNFNYRKEADSIRRTCREHRYEAPYRCDSARDYSRLYASHDYGLPSRQLRNFAASRPGGRHHSDGLCGRSGPTRCTCVGARFRRQAALIGSHRQWRRGHRPHGLPARADSGVIGARAGYCLAGAGVVVAGPIPTISRTHSSSFAPS